MIVDQANDRTGDRRKPITVEGNGPMATMLRG